MSALGGSAQNELLRSMSVNSATGSNNGISHPNQLNVEDDIPSYKNQALKIEVSQVPESEAPVSLKSFVVNQPPPEESYELALIETKPLDRPVEGTDLIGFIEETRIRPLRAEDGIIVHDLYKTKEIEAKETPYIPMDYARNKLLEVAEDARRVREENMMMVTEMETQYRILEQTTRLAYDQRLEKAKFRLKTHFETQRKQMRDLRKEHEAEVAALKERMAAHEKAANKTRADLVEELRTSESALKEAESKLTGLVGELSVVAAAVEKLEAEKATIKRLTTLVAKTQALRPKIQTTKDVLEGKAVPVPLTARSAASAAKDGDKKSVSGTDGGQGVATAEGEDKKGATGENGEDAEDNDDGLAIVDDDSEDDEAKQGDDGEVAASPRDGRAAGSVMSSSSTEELSVESAIALLGQIVEDVETTLDVTQVHAVEHQKIAQDFAALQALFPSLTAAAQDKTRLEGEMEALNAARQEAEGRIDALTKSVEETQAQADKAAAEVEEVRKQLEAVEEEKRQLQETLTELKKRRSSLPPIPLTEASLPGSVPTPGQGLSPEQSLRNEIDRLEARVETELAVVESRRAELQMELQERSTDKAKAARAAEVEAMELDALKAEVMRADDRIGDLQQQLVTALAAPQIHAETAQLSRITFAPDAAGGLTDDEGGSGDNTAAILAQQREVARLQDRIKQLEQQLLDSTADVLRQTEGLVPDEEEGPTSMPADTSAEAIAALLKDDPSASPLPSPTPRSAAVERARNIALQDAQLEIKAQQRQEFFQQKVQDAALTLIRQKKVPGVTLSPTGQVIIDPKVAAKNPSAQAIALAAQGHAASPQEMSSAAMAIAQASGKEKAVQQAAGGADAPAELMVAAVVESMGVAVPDNFKNDAKELAAVTAEREQESKEREQFFQQKVREAALDLIRRNEVPGVTILVNGDIAVDSKVAFSPEAQAISAAAQGRTQLPHELSRAAVAIAQAKGINQEVKNNVSSNASPEETVAAVVESLGVSVPQKYKDEAKAVTLKKEAKAQVLHNLSPEERARRKEFKKAEKERRARLRDEFFQQKVREAALDLIRRNEVPGVTISAQGQVVVDQNVAQSPEAQAISAAAQGKIQSPQEMSAAAVAIAEASGTTASVQQSVGAGASPELMMAAVVESLGMSVPESIKEDAKAQAIASAERTRAAKERDDFFKQKVQDAAVDLIKRKKIKGVSINSSGKVVVDEKAATPETTAIAHAAQGVISSPQEMSVAALAIAQASGVAESVHEVTSNAPANTPEMTVAAVMESLGVAVPAGFKEEVKAQAQAVADKEKFERERDEFFQKKVREAAIDLIRRNAVPGISITKAGKVSVDTKVAKSPEAQAMAAAAEGKKQSPQEMKQAAVAIAEANGTTDVVKQSVSFNPTNEEMTAAVIESLGVPVPQNFKDGSKPSAQAAAVEPDSDDELPPPPTPVTPRRSVRHNTQHQDLQLAKDMAELARLRVSIAALRKSLKAVSAELESKRTEVSSLQQQLSQANRAARQAAAQGGMGTSSSRNNLSRSASQRNIGGDEVGLSRSVSQVSLTGKDAPAQVEVLKRKLEDLTKKLEEEKKKNAAAGKAGAAGGKALAGGATSAGGSGGDPQRVKQLEMELRDKEKEHQRALKELQQKFEKASKGTGNDLMKLQTNYNKSMERADKLQAELEECQAQLKRASKAEESLGSEAKELRTRIEGLEAEVARLTSVEAEAASLRQEVKTLSDMYKLEKVKRIKLYNEIEDMKGKVRVYCRVRPLNKREMKYNEENGGAGLCCEYIDEYSIKVTPPTASLSAKEFQFDRVFQPDESQDVVFEDTKRLVYSCIDGYNVCIFAYGQTGSGKTHTMIGNVGDPKEEGLAPRAIFELFSGLNTLDKEKFSWGVSMYMLELYNKKFNDLLFEGKRSPDDKGVVVKMDANSNAVRISGATIKEVTTAEEALKAFLKGASSRVTHATQMNAQSSRSHLVFALQTRVEDKKAGKVSNGKLSFIDLAGSERQSKTEATGDRLREGREINMSLSALGDVIAALSSQKEGIHIPYRNHELTVLMSDSLGGTAKTLMFVNVSPSDFNAEETLTSLTYAARAKNIQNKASKSVDSAEIAKLKKKIADLADANFTLRGQLVNNGIQPAIADID